MAHNNKKGNNMADFIKIKPKDGIRVIDEQTGKPIPSGGKTVEMSQYWGRRLKDGDVINVSGCKNSSKDNTAQTSKKKDK